MLKGKTEDMSKKCRGGEIQVLMIEMLESEGFVGIVQAYPIRDSRTDYWFRLLCCFKGVSNTVIFLKKFDCYPRHYAEEIELEETMARFATFVQECKSMMQNAGALEETLTLLWKHSRWIESPAHWLSKANLHGDALTTVAPRLLADQHGKEVKIAHLSSRISRLHTQTGSLEYEASEAQRLLDEHLAQIAEFEESIRYLQS